MGDPGGEISTSIPDVKSTFLPEARDVRECRPGPSLYIGEPKMFGGGSIGMDRSFLQAANAVAAAAAYLRLREGSRWVAKSN